MLRRNSFSVLFMLVLGLALPALTASLNAQVNAVYVESNINTTNGNSILGFSNDGLGNLAPLPNSPYLTSGTGWGVPEGQQLGFQQDDDQQIVIDPAGVNLYAVNGHSNTISSFVINSDASLTLNGTPVNSAGSQPASLGLVSGLPDGANLLVVVNKTSDTSQTNPKAPNIVSFIASATGTLTPNVGSKITYPTGTSPSQAVVGTGKLVMVDEFMASPSQIGVYRIRSNGKFNLITTVPVPPGTSVFLGMAASPVSDYIYAALPVEGMIAIYSYVPGTGLMTLTSTVSGPGGLPCWIAVNQAGTRLYTGDTSTSSVSVYDVTDPAAPVFMQQLQLSTALGNAQPWNVQVDPTGQFLYAVAGVGLHAINIQSDGTLVELAAPTLIDVPSGTYPYGLASIVK